MHDHQGTYFLPWPQGHEQETMERFHGSDRHKAYSTISVLNQEGLEIAVQLGLEDAVVLEVCSDTRNPYVNTSRKNWSECAEKGLAFIILDPLGRENELEVGEFQEKFLYQVLRKEDV